MADAAADSPVDVDSQLLLRLGQRDEQALGALYDHYGARVYTIALRITQQQTLAEAAVQDVFRTVWQLAGRLPGGVNLEAWMIDLVRQHASELAQPRAVTLRMRREAYPEEYSHAPGKQGERLADTRNVPGLLNALPAEQREALELAYYDRLTCREIATRLRESLSTITSRLRSGLGTFSEALSKASDDMDEQNLWRKDTVRTHSSRHLGEEQSLS
jgi:RNA polymerase sigma-70 factor (ECF subfamily)